MKTFCNIFRIAFCWIYADQVCYPPYGCFDKSSPYNFTFIPLPADPVIINTQFILYTQEREINLDICFGNDQSIPPDFHKDKKLVVITHGYLESGDMSWIKEMTEEILKKDNANVITVSWEKAARFTYHQAVANIRIVGSQLAYLLECILQKTPLKADKIHLIGFSLGAHLMGNAGMKLTAKGIKVGRITGLDPAGPVFEKSSPDFQLDPSDANYVDVIHTDIKTLPIYSIGINQVSGHCDYFPNGGYDQPGCDRVSFDTLTRRDIYQMVSCSHYRAAHYFIESIKNKYAFQSFPCETYDAFKRGRCHIKRSTYMGYFSNKEPGIYYFMTRGKAPFTGFHYQVEISTGSKLFSDTVGTVKLQLIGEEEASELVQLKESSFEVNSKKKHVIFVGENIGNLKQIRVNHDTGLFIEDNWFVMYIRVISLQNLSKRYVGCVNNWIGDQEITVDLHADNSGEITFCQV